MKLLVCFVYLFLSPVACAKVTKTFYLKILGDQKMGNRLIERLGEKDCLSSGDLCHAFRKFEDISQIDGDFSKMGSSLLYQVKITKQNGIGSYNLQIFQRDGKALRRVRNAGTFTPQNFKGSKGRKIDEEEFFDQLAESTASISFK